MVPESPPFPSAKFITHSPDSETSVERFDFLPIPRGMVQEICACTAFVILVGRFFLPSAIMYCTIWPRYLFYEVHHEDRASSGAQGMMMKCLFHLNSTGFDQVRGVIDALILRLPVNQG
ncbi:hypothetical protein I312_103788 [Cryptococcus bacillisporus CA1280]|uniref:uncharacterized protein n=1 Tax=Cryptococcus bacillisporus CA1280 TaxID=1296109 RepID=UPI0033688B7D